MSKSRSHTFSRLFSKASRHMTFLGRQDFSTLSHAGTLRHLPVQPLGHQVDL